MSNKLSRRSDGDIFSFLPPGTVLPFAGDVAPTGWAICNGDEKERAKFPQLFSAINTIHGTGDGFSTFRLPDYRGRFLRGVDETGVRDPDFASRSADTDGNTAGVGSNQGHAIENIKGQFGSKSAESFATPPFADIGGVLTNSNGAGSSGTLYEFDASTSVETSTETRSKNSAVNYIIRLGIEVPVIAPPNPPVIPVITTLSTDPTADDPISFSVDFGEPVSGFILNDIVVVNGTKSNFAGGTQVYTFDVSPTANGNVTVTIPASVANSIATSEPNNVANLTIEYASAPVVPVTTVLSTSVTNPTSNNPIEYAITFSEPVYGVGVTSVVAITDVGTYTVSNMQGTGANYTFDVTLSESSTILNIQVNAVAGFSVANNTPSNASNTLSNQAYESVLDGVFMDGAVNPGKFSGEVKDVAIQIDGKVLVCGDFTYNAFVCTGLARFLPDGSPDTIFNGTIGTKFGSQIVHTVTTQNVEVAPGIFDEKILVGGNFVNFDTANVGNGVNCLVRLSSNGLTDTAFCNAAVRNGTTGNFTWAGASEVRDIKVSSIDNSIYVGGSWGNYNNVVGDSNLTKFDEDGIQDITFRNNAVVGNFTNWHRVKGAVNTIDEQQDGKIVFGGEFLDYGLALTTHANHLARVSSAGIEDTAFMSQAVVNSGIAPKLSGIINKVKTPTVSGNIKIFIGGIFNHIDNAGTNMIMRFSETGSAESFLNNNFFNGGVSKFGSGSVHDIEIQSDDKIIIGGTFSNYDSVNIGTGVGSLLRTSALGALDTVFIEDVVRNKTSGRYQAILEQPDGKIVIGGLFINYINVGNNYLIRLNDI